MKKEEVKKGAMGNPILGTKYYIKSKKEGKPTYFGWVEYKSIVYPAFEENKTPKGYHWVI